MRARKSKANGQRARLTRFEILRGGSLRLRLSISDEALSEAGEELGSLIRKITPCAASTAAAVPDAPSPETGVLVSSSPCSAEFIISPQHSTDDAAYHAGLRDRLAELFSSLCDTSLTDALEIARDERARRAEGGN